MILEWIDPPSFNRMEDQMANSNVPKYYQLVKLIKNMSKKDRNIILNFLDNGSIHFLCEVVHNVIKSRIKLTPDQKQQIKSSLEDRKLCYRNIASRKKPLRIKKQLIKQNGNGIGLILSIAIPALQAIVEAISKSRKK
jgi:hypothetical protein